jgi:DNA-binding winged helix-turn-helix (wHTH) protein/tetratricopeptide (TPR) repeat protein
MALEKSMAALASRFRFGSFELDRSSNELRKNGVRIGIEEQPFRALCILISRQNELVTREELKEALWADDTHVDFDRCLNRAVNKARLAIGDSASNPRFIETLSRRGYRFIAPVTIINEPQKNSHLTPEVSSSSASPETSPKARLKPGTVANIGGDPIVPAQEPPTATGPTAESGIQQTGFWTVWRSLFAAGLILAVSVTVALAFVWWRGQRTGNSEFEKSYSDAMHLLRRRDLNSMVTAADEFRRLVHLHPQFAPGWALLAEASALVHSEDASASLELAERSVRLDSRCGECHAILGFILFTRHWKWKEAGEHLGRAVSLSPDDPQIRYWMAQLEAAQGHVKQALRSIDEALERMPQAMNLLVMKAGCLYFAKEYQAALHLSDQALALNLTAAWQWRASTLFQLGKYMEAVRSLAYDRGMGSSRSLENIALRADALVGRFEAAGLRGALGELIKETSSNEISGIQSHSRATWFMLLGEYDSAIHELEIAADSHPRPFNLIYVNVDPVFDPIRTYPQFQSLVRRLGIT